MEGFGGSKTELPSDFTILYITFTLPCCFLPSDCSIIKLSNNVLFLIFFKELNMKKLVLALLVGLLSLTALFGCVPKDDSFDGTQDIRVVTREDGSGTRGAFLELIGAKDKAIKAGASVTTGTSDLIAKVASMKYSIGYASTGAVDSTVKALKVNGVEATSANILSGDYELARPFLVIHGDEAGLSDLQKDFMAFLKSKQVQDLAKEENLVEVVGTGYGATYTAPATAFPSGSELKVTGSTSIKDFMEAIGEEYKALNPNVTVIVGGSGSGDAKKALDAGTADFGIISRERNQGEIDAGYAELSIAIDGISIIVNKANDLVDSITFDQLKGVFIAGGAIDGLNTVDIWNELVAE